METRKTKNMLVIPDEIWDDVLWGMSTYPIAHHDLGIYPTGMISDLFINSFIVLFSTFDSFTAHMSLKALLRQNSCGVRVRVFVCACESKRRVGTEKEIIKWE